MKLNNGPEKVIDPSTSWEPVSTLTCAGQVINNEMETTFMNSGSKHRPAPMAERHCGSMNLTARTMMIHSGPSKRWWAEAINTAAFLRNRTPNTKTKGQTPHELVLGNVSTLAKLKVLGFVSFRRIGQDVSTRQQINASIVRTPKSHTPMMRESTNESVSNARGSARLEEVAQRRKAVAARTTETQLDERPPLHPVRSSASPYNADMPFMEAPANTTRTEDGERGVTTPEIRWNAGQCALLWYLHFKNVLEVLWFQATLSDGCVFILRVDGHLQIITTYVDDALVCARIHNEIDGIFSDLQRDIRLNDKGSRVDTPIPADNLAADAGLPLDDKPFRTIVGSLMYCAMVTLPDIVLAVTQLSLLLSVPHQLHMHLARLVVTPISWRSKLQAIVTMSTTGPNLSAPVCRRSTACTYTL
ncbi:hypothetical protein B5M09_005204 [Aphanomyces astaci]|uniref:Reverse transcriptase Ty1/copia-type domain-containing protein n=1 Tax=Aphanomyces astaci TaxID=112090 RepID=A0A3R7ZN34_APHAT|nr:hypothetical protein B5M09_005204 [Aphanomyces astaci]